MGFGIIGGIATRIVNFGRKLGRKFGYEIRVELSDHSIKTHVVDPNSDNWAWDPNLYKYGNVFVAGYANPIKPRVEYHSELEHKDKVKLRPGSTVGIDSPTLADGGQELEPVSKPHTDIIASPRYRQYMRQDLISQILNPQEQWRKLFYAIVAAIIISSLSVVLSASAAGVI